MRDFKHKNQWALILGGSSGLGLATAKKLARHGLHICVVYRSPRFREEKVQLEFEKIKKEGVDFQSYNIDALKSGKRKMVIDELTTSFDGSHKIKVLVHSIAKGNLKPMLSDEAPRLNSKDFELTIQAMAVSLYDWVTAVYEANLFADDARVLSFTSEGNTRALPHYGAVSAAKAALEAITRNIATEYGRTGLKANCIQAGVTETASLKMIPGSERIIKHALERNPQNRLTRPEDVADVVYLMTKDESAWINGTVIIADGGEHLS